METNEVKTEHEPKVQNTSRMPTMAEYLNTLDKDNKHYDKNTKSNQNEIPKNQKEFGHRKRIKP